MERLSGSEEVTISLMLVDDHAIVRDAISQMIQSATPWRVLAQLESGSALLRRLEVEQPDLIVLDINMPGISGQELIGRLRISYPEVRVVVLSMDDTEQVVRRVLAAGASAYVLKASDLKVLISAIEAAHKGQSFVDPALIGPLLNSSVGKEPSTDHPSKLLSRREMQVLELILEGLALTTIADRLYVSIKTVSTHKSNIMEKLGLATTMELFQYATKHDLMQQPRP